MDQFKFNLNPTKSSNMLFVLLANDALLSVA